MDRSGSGHPEAGGIGKVSFVATGPNGTAGWATIKIPKAFVAVLLLAQPAPQAAEVRAGPTLLIDGSEGPFFLSQDADFYYVTFQIHFSTHNVEIDFKQIAAATANTSPSGSTGSSSTSGTGQVSSSSLSVSYLALAAFNAVLIGLVALLLRRRLFSRDASVGSNTDGTAQRVLQP